MSESVNTQAIGQFTGRYPLGRIIVILFVVASVAGGIRAATLQSAESTPVYAERYTIYHSDGEILLRYRTIGDDGTTATIEGVDGDQWQCNGSVQMNNCSIIEGSSPGPVLPIGYGTAEQAQFHCDGGTVRTLYRQYQIVGYGCEGGSQ